MRIPEILQSLSVDSLLNKTMPVSDVHPRKLKNPIFSIDEGILDRQSDGQI